MTKQTKFLTTPQVLAIHDQVVKRFGGSLGLRDLGLLQASVERPKATFSKKFLYKSLFEKAAALFQSLLKNHPFIDGNKRTALTAAGIFLKMNGFELQNTHQEEVRFTLKVDQENLTVEQISKWLKDHSISS